MTPNIRITDQDLKYACHPTIALKAANDWLTNQIAQGLQFVGELKFYYLGIDGSWRQEVNENVLQGRDDDIPRLEGFYAITAANPDGTDATPGKPWLAVFQTQARVMDNRERGQESHWEAIGESYRLRLAEKERDVKQAEAKVKTLAHDLELSTGAINQLRREKLAQELRADEAIVAAAKMEHDLQQERMKRLEAEADAASFQPQIQQFVDGVADKAGPLLGSLLLPPGASWPPSNTNGATAAPPTAGGAMPAPPPPAQPGEPISSDDLRDALYEVWWLNEQFGRFFVEQAGGNWEFVRGVVFHVKGIDLGPTPKWPSDVKREAEEEEAADAAKQQPPAEAAGA